MSGIRITCPYCGKDSTVRSSRQVTPATREFWAICQNVGCACSFWGMLEVRKLLSPSIYPAPRCHLPTVRRVDDDWPGEGIVIPKTPVIDMFDDRHPPPQRE